MKKTLIGLCILIVLAIVVGWFASLRGSSLPGPTATSQDILGGVATTSGNMEYAEDTNTYHIDILYPAHTPLAGAVDIQARAAMQQGLADLVAQFKQDGNFANLTAQDIAYQNITPEHKYALDVSYKAYTGSGTASYLFTVYEDTLGAHPNGYFKTFVFDSQGRGLALGDLARGDYLTKLSQAATTQVTAQLTARLGADASSSIFADGLTPKADNFQNFVVDDTTLVIEIPPYQVAAYAAGNFEVRVPLSDLK